MNNKEKRIKEIEETLHNHDVAFTQLEEDLKKVENEYTKTLIKTHIQTIINNVILLKEELEGLQK
jgi:hypothetical protein